MSSSGSDAALDKMRAEGARRRRRGDLRAATTARLSAGETGLLAGADIEPVDELPDADALPDPRPSAARSDHTVVIKLNGGLGTSMGMTRAKSLLQVKDGLTLPRHHRAPGPRPARSARAPGCRSC